MANVLEKKYNEIDFEEELSKQNYLKEVEKVKLMQLCKKHKDLFKGKVGHCTNSEVKLRFKEASSKRHQCEPHSAAETHKKLMKDFLEVLREKKVLLKVDTVEWLSPVLCQGKSGGVIRLLTERVLRKARMTVRKDR